MNGSDLHVQTVAAGRARRGVALAALSLTFGVVQLDATIVNVALQTLRRDLGGGVGATQWVVDGYAVPFAAFMLTAGAIGDRFGHRRTCVAGFAVFGVASAVAAASGGWTILVGARVVQGVGAALMLPPSLAMISTLYPEPRERSRALGVWGGIATLGFASGPLLGGVLITVASWPAIFWINVPIVVVVGGTIAAIGPRDHRRPRRIHPVGTAFGTLALGALTAALIEAGERRPLTASVAAGLGILTGCLFVRAERRVPEPLVPSTLIGSSPFRWSLATGFCFNFGMYGALLCTSLTLQATYGFSAMAGGLAVLPMALVVSVGATGSGFLAAALGPRRPMLAGFGFAGVGAIIIGAGALAGSAPVIIVGLTVIGLCSLAMPAMTSVALAAAPEGHAGLAGGALNTARQVGGAMGVALLGAVLNAGGVRSGFALALGIAAIGFVVGMLSSLESTARGEPE